MGRPARETCKSSQLIAEHLSALTCGESTCFQKPTKPLLNQQNHAREGNSLQRPRRCYACFAFCSLTGGVCLPLLAIGHIIWSCMGIESLLPTPAFTLRRFAHQFIIVLVVTYIKQNLVLKGKEAVATWSSFCTHALLR